MSRWRGPSFNNGGHPPYQPRGFGIAPVMRPRGGNFSYRGGMNNWNGPRGPRPSMNYPRQHMGSSRPPMHYPRYPSRGGYRTPGRGEIIRLGPSRSHAIGKVEDTKPNSSSNVNLQPLDNVKHEEEKKCVVEKIEVGTEDSESNEKQNEKNESSVAATDLKSDIVVKTELQPPLQQIKLDTSNSELHMTIDESGFIGQIMRGAGFEYMWGGVRATHGVKSGKVCFEVHIIEQLSVDIPNESNLYVTRIGWSTDGSDYQLGEDKFSWGYGGTAKSSNEGKFRDYGRTFGVGDTVTCYIDLDATPKAIFYMVNGDYLGVAFRITDEHLKDEVLFPHITCKNMKFEVNFGAQQPKFPLTNGFCMIQKHGEVLKSPTGPSRAEEAEIIMMVGLPASGKSYWCEKYAKEHPEKKYYILGTNLIIDRMKVSNLNRKRNYHGRWEELIKRASNILNILFKVAKQVPKNYILDQTNVYCTARRRKMDSFCGYKRIAAVIINKPDILRKRTEKQQNVEGKIVPDAAVMEMKRNFTLPEVGASFDDVWFLEETMPKACELLEGYKKEGEEFKDSGLNRPFSKIKKTNVDERKTKLETSSQSSSKNYSQKKLPSIEEGRPRDVQRNSREKAAYSDGRSTERSRSRDRERDSGRSRGMERRGEERNRDFDRNRNVDRVRDVDRSRSFDRSRDLGRNREYGRGEFDRSRDWERFRDVDRNRDFVRDTEKSRDFDKGQDFDRHRDRVQDVSYGKEAFERRRDFDQRRDIGERRDVLPLRDINQRDVLAKDIIPDYPLCGNRTNDQFVALKDNEFNCGSESYRDDMRNRFQRDVISRKVFPSRSLNITEHQDISATNAYTIKGNSDEPPPPVFFRNPPYQAGHERPARESFVQSPIDPYVSQRDYMREFNRDGASDLRSNQKQFYNDEAPRREEIYIDKKILPKDSFQEPRRERISENLYSERAEPNRFQNQMNFVPSGREELLPPNNTGFGREACQVGNFNQESMSRADITFERRNLPVSGNNFYDDDVRRNNRYGLGAEARSGFTKPSFGREGYENIRDERKYAPLNEKQLDNPYSTFTPRQREEFPMRQDADKSGPPRKFDSDAKFSQGNSNENNFRKLDGVYRDSSYVEGVRNERPIHSQSYDTFERQHQEFGFNDQTNYRRLPPREQQASDNTSYNKQTRVETDDSFGRFEYFRKNEREPGYPRSEQTFQQGGYVKQEKSPYDAAPREAMRQPHVYRPTEDDYKHEQSRFMPQQQPPYNRRSPNQVERQQYNTDFHSAQDRSARGYGAQSQKKDDLTTYSYQTQMTTSTANYQQPNYHSSAKTYEQENPKLSPYRDYLQKTADSPNRPAPQSSGSKEVSAASKSGNQSFEQQQQDYQKAYSQWYANYAQAFAQLAQQSPK